MIYEISDGEARLRKAQENYREMLRKARDPEYQPKSGPYRPEYQPKSGPYRLRVSKKHWENDLAVLTGNELKVYLHYRVNCDWETGISFVSARKMSQLLKLNRETILEAQKSLVKKGYLAKLERKGRTFSYKVLKI